MINTKPKPKVRENLIYPEVSRMRAFLVQNGSPSPNNERDLAIGSSFAKMEEVGVFLGSKWKPLFFLMRKWSPNLPNRLKLSGEIFFQREWNSEQNFQKRMEFGALVADDSQIQNYRNLSAAFLREQKGHVLRSALSENTVFNEKNVSIS
jgi:hypothetical protein